MFGLAHGRVTSVDFDPVRNELDVRDEVFVTLLNLGKRNMLALNCGLLRLVLFFIGHLGDFNLSATRHDSVLG